MTEAKPVHLVTLVGGRLDRAAEAERLTRWRPSTALSRHFRPARVDLVTVPKFAALARALAEDIAALSPGTEVHVYVIPADPLWDFVDNFDALTTFARQCPFDPDTHDVLVNITNGTFVAQICLFLLTESRELPGRLVACAEREIANPFTVIDLDLARYDRLAQRFAERSTDGQSFLKNHIHTRNAAYNATIARLEKVVTRSTDPILLTGATGTGKTVLAERIYALKRARGMVCGPFVVINCATLRGDNAYSALFGHERGSFTGAVEARKGLLRTAEGGVLFLDEVGELGADEQAMLLRGIEEKLVLPLGADREVKVDFQLICGTNRDLSRRAADGTLLFRDDLLARIGIWRVHMPNLADRAEDLEPNVDYELHVLSAELGRRVSFNREARVAWFDFARDAPWPANFRDLRASIRRMATLSDGGRITLAEVNAETADLRGWWGGSATGRPTPESASTSWPPPMPLAATTLKTRFGDYDRVDLAKLETVLRACKSARTMLEAARKLKDVTLAGNEGPNDGQYVSYTLSTFGLSKKDVFED